ncbi:MAG: phosphatidylglycerophosphatase A [Planctomycetota bacterium]
MRRALATFFYIGRLPVAPGTAASICAWALAVVIVRADAPSWVLGVLAVGVAGLGAILARHAFEDFGEEDPPSFVLDEVAGTLLAISFLPIASAQAGFWLGVLALVLFRAFDILKPPPCRFLETLPHGIGVMADDLAAGLMANVATQIVSFVTG